MAQRNWMFPQCHLHCYKCHTIIFSEDFISTALLRTKIAVRL